MERKLEIIDKEIIADERKKISQAAHSFSRVEAA